MRREATFRLTNLIYFCCLLPAGAGLDLTILQPGSNFVTSNQILHLQAEIVSTTPSPIIVSVNTPAGVQSLAELEYSIHAVQVDLGQLLKIKGLLIRPLPQPHYPLGPRTVTVAFSNNGQTFSTPLTLSAPSSLSPELRRILIDLPEPITTRYIRLEMVEGWQSDRIAIQAFELLDEEKRIVQANLQLLSLQLETSKPLDLEQPNKLPRVIFDLNLILQNGENRITVAAQIPNLNQLDQPFTGGLSTNKLNQRDSVVYSEETILLYYLAELNTAATENGYFTLSDGAQAQIRIPENAFDLADVYAHTSAIRKLQFTPVKADQISRLSYLTNPRIADGTSPVVVYRFEALRQESFMAEASSELPYQPATLAVDGIRHPPSTWMTRLTPLPISLTVNLVKQRSIGQVVVYAHVAGEKSFGPKSGTIHISDDNIKFVEVLTFDQFEDRRTVIDLPTRPKAQFVQLEVTESQQVNNVQIDEIEFFDPSGTPITTFTTFDHLLLHQPAQLQLSYRPTDLLRAGVRQEENLRLFTWEDSAQEWQIVGGIVDTTARTVQIQLNYIATFAVFETTLIQPRFSWSFNPFSPDNNGVADTTRLMLTIPGTGPPIGDSVEGELDLTGISAPELVVGIFDINNKLIRMLIDRTTINTRAVSIEWDGKDRTGATVDIGVYIYQIRLGEYHDNGIIVVGR